MGGVKKYKIIFVLRPPGWLFSKKHQYLRVEHSSNIILSPGRPHGRKFLDPETGKRIYLFGSPKGPVIYYGRGRVEEIFQKSYFIL